MNVKFHIKTDTRMFLSGMLILLTAIFDFPNISEPKVPNIDGYQLHTIVLDAGHGGKDPGCHGNHVLEKDIALAITLSLGRQLQKTYPDVNIIYTRDEDVFIPLHERANLANKAKADLFVSIHCNYIAKRNKAKGTETFVMGLHRAKENLDVAKRENATILMEDDFEMHYDGYAPNSPEGHIMLSMYQNAHLAQSILLAQKIENNFAKQLGRKSRGVKQAGFLVLRKTAMPSVLIETGFLSTDEEEAFLSDADKQTDVAYSIMQAITGYKMEMEGISPEIKAKDLTDKKDEITVEVTYPTDDRESKTELVSYRIQLAATSKNISLDDLRWKGLTQMQQIKEADYYKYLCGNFSSLTDAKLGLKKVQQKGFDQAFIVAYQGDRRISFEEALKYARAE